MEANYSLASVSPDGKYVAVASGFKVLVHDLSSGRERYVGPGCARIVSDIAFAPDSRTLAVAIPGYSVSLWDVDGQLRWNGFDDSAAAIAFSPDGRLLATGNNKGRVALWDVATHDLVTVLRAPFTGIGLPWAIPAGMLLAWCGVVWWMTKRWRSAVVWSAAF